MLSLKNAFGVALLLPAVLSGCGLYVPEKGFLSEDEARPPNASPEGMYENNVVAHIRCEIRNGVWKVLHGGPNGEPLPNVQWLKSYGAIVTLRLTAEEQSGLNPGLSLLTPLVQAQSFTLGLGASGSANATRVETIQFTFTNAELLKEAKEDFNNGITSCEGFQHGVLIESNLKIDQFIYDKAVIAGAAGEATSKSLSTPPYSQFQEELTFLTAFGGSVTPTWKFTRISVNPSSPLFSATRTDTNYVEITLGPVAVPARGNMQAQLTADTQNLHESALFGSSTALAIQGLSH